jgi:UDP-2,3-diacylglucosamine pyrophosphatase LpxH
LNGIIYANCGDFVENCTAIAENADGSLKLIDWRTEMIKNRLIILPAAE